MICLHLWVFLLGTLATAQSAVREVVAAGRHAVKTTTLQGISILGVAPDNSVWIAQYDTASSYSPGITKTNLRSKKLPSATIVGNDGEILEINTLEDDGKVTRTYIKGGKEDWSIGADGKLVSAPQVEIWPLGVPALVGLGPDGSFSGTTLGGKNNGLEWTNLGGQFSSDPAIILDEYKDRLHVYGIAKENGKLVHKQFTPLEWGKTWETFSDGPFKGGIATSSEDYKDLDYQRTFHLWTLDSKGALLHKTFLGVKYSDWENLGGKFEKTPRAIHMFHERIDVVGRNPETGEYSHKSYDYEGPSGSGGKLQWSEKWNDIKGISYTSEPVLASSSEKPGQTPHIYIIGVTKDGTINAHYMDVNAREPSPIDDEGNPIQQLGNVNDPYKKEEATGWDDL